MPARPFLRLDRMNTPTILSRANAAPPLPGMLSRQLATAIRAYGRRAPLLRTEHTLRALKATDQRLDMLMAACRYYGGTAAQDEAAASHALALPTDRAGAVLVRIAISEAHEADAAQRLALIAQLLQEQPVAVRDGLWFHAADDTCGLLLSSSDDRLLALGVELAGLLALPIHLDAVHAAAKRGADTEACLLACARMGQLPDQAAPRLAAVLQGYDLALQRRALEVLCVAGGGLLQRELARYIERLTANDGPTEASHPGLWASAADTAMALWTARQPEQALAAVTQGLRLPPDTVLRAVALAGRLPALLPTLRFIEQQDRPVTPAERDLLRLVFGKVPGELTHTHGQAPARIAALRALACEVFCANGCQGLEPGHISDWTDPALKERLWALDGIRLRAGQPLHTLLPLEEAFDVGHSLRRWLYVEHAANTGRPFPLSHEDHAQRQMTAVETIQLISSLEDKAAAP